MVNSKKDNKFGEFFQNLDIEFLIHELKDPIAVIETGARTLLEKQDKFGELSSRQERTMKRIIRNTRKAQDMLYSLLEVGRSEAGSFACGTFEPVETTFTVLCDCLELKNPSISDELQKRTDMIEAISYLNSFEIYFSAEPEMTTKEINQDLGKYRQIVGNLIKNALHFRRKRIQIKLETKNEYLHAAIIDDGPGINPEECEAIFKRYSQSKDCTLTSRQGHGLGLAGARTMARYLGGDIELECDPDIGTVFRLTLPTDLAKMV
jgi:signal transduction histidine kinase